MDTHKLISGLTALLEADAAGDQARYVAKKTPALQQAIARVFRQQGKQLAAALRPFRVQEAGVAYTSWLSNWQAEWGAATGATYTELSSTLETAVLEALLFSGAQLLEILDVDGKQLGISFDLANPRAVAYAEQHAAAQVTRINDTTRAYLNTLITQAADEGWSYERLSEAIEARFAEFATGGDRPRSWRIAVFELGDAYEAGNEMAARELQAVGIRLEKKWLTVGDDRVRPSHRANQGQGWIDYDDAYQSGDFRPPTDPGCRCVTLTRRKRV